MCGNHIFKSWFLLKSCYSSSVPFKSRWHCNIIEILSTIICKLSFLFYSRWWFNELELYWPLWCFEKCDIILHIWMDSCENCWQPLTLVMCFFKRRLCMFWRLIKVHVSFCLTGIQFFCEIDFFYTFLTLTQQP